MATEQVNDEQHLNRCNRILAAFESGLGDDDIFVSQVELFCQAIKIDKPDDQMLAVIAARLDLIQTKHVETASSSISVTMYYDEYERIYGDGFYPQLNNNDPALTKQTEIIFKKMCLGHINRGGILIPDMAWRQINEGCINGLDGNCGADLLTYLNALKNGNNIPGTILSSNMELLYPKKR
jgi:hypothetical protein